VAARGKAIGIALSLIGRVLLAEHAIIDCSYNASNLYLYGALAAAMQSKREYK
jgi:hypothetical protein